jgi:hypothetical protein
MVGYRRKFFQSLSNLRSLFHTQRSEAKSVLSSQRPHNLRGDCLFAGLGQLDFERDTFFKCQVVSNERVHAALTKITRPPLQAKVLASPLKADLNPFLEHVPRRDPALRTGFIRRRSCHLFLAASVTSPVANAARDTIAFVDPDCQEITPSPTLQYSGKGKAVLRMKYSLRRSISRLDRTILTDNLTNNLALGSSGNSRVGKIRRFSHAFTNT